MEGQEKHLCGFLYIIYITQIIVINYKKIYINNLFTNNMYSSQYLFLNHSCQILCLCYV